MEKHQQDKEATREDKTRRREGTRQDGRQQQEAKKRGKQSFDFSTQKLIAKPSAYEEH